MIMLVNQLILKSWLVTIFSVAVNYLQNYKCFIKNVQNVGLKGEVSGVMVHVSVLGGPEDKVPSGPYIKGPCQDLALKYGRYQDFRERVSLFCSGAHA